MEVKRLFVAAAMAALFPATTMAAEITVLASRVTAPACLKSAPAGEIWRSGGFATP
jgi:hypothetical protein